MPIFTSKVKSSRFISYFTGPHRPILFPMWPASQKEFALKYRVHQRFFEREIAQRRDFWTRNRAANFVNRNFSFFFVASLSDAIFCLPIASVHEALIIPYYLGCIFKIWQLDLFTRFCVFQTQKSLYYRIADSQMFLFGGRDLSQIAKI